MLENMFLGYLPQANPKNFLLYTLFFICFDLLLLNFFIAILIRSFLELERKVGPNITAMARISAAESRAFTQKWINLICMKPPMDEDEDDHKKRDEIVTISSIKCRSSSNFF